MSGIWLIISVSWKGQGQEEVGAEGKVSGNGKTCWSRVSGRRTLSWKESMGASSWRKGGFWIPHLKGFFTTPFQTSASNLAAGGWGRGSRAGRGRVEGRTRGEHTLALNWSFPSSARHQAINSDLVISPWHLYLLASL